MRFYFLLMLPFAAQPAFAQDADNSWYVGFGGGYGGIGTVVTRATAVEGEIVGSRRDTEDSGGLANTSLLGRRLGNRFGIEAESWSTVSGVSSLSTLSMNLVVHQPVGTRNYIYGGAGYAGYVLTQDEFDDESSGGALFKIGIGQRLQDHGSLTLEYRFLDIADARMSSTRTFSSGAPDAVDTVDIERDANAIMLGYRFNY